MSINSPGGGNTVPEQYDDGALEQRFSDQRIHELTQQLIADRGLENIANGRKFAVVKLEPNDPFTDVAVSLETRHFADVFSRKLSDVYEEYEPLAPWSTHLLTIDMVEAMPAGSARLVANSEEMGLKSFEDLVKDSPDNPWIEEIKSHYFSEGETYDASVAKTRLLQAIDLDDFNPDLAYDVATRSVRSGYNSKGAVDGVSTAMLHSVFWQARTDEKAFLVTIQDVIPLQAIQAFGQPFDVFPNLKPHPYGGPFDTLPAFASMERGIQRIKTNAPDIVPYFLEGEGLISQFALLKETELNR